MYLNFKSLADMNLPYYHMFSW